jgi:hypothetical protein
MSAAPIARTHAHAPDAPQVGDIGAHWGTGGPLPGDLVGWRPSTYTARAILADPPEAIRRAATLDPITRAGALLAVGDAALRRGDAATARTAYGHARRAVELRVSRRARPLEIAAIFGLALVAAGSGDPWAALAYCDALQALAEDIAPMPGHNHHDAPGAIAEALALSHALAERLLAHLAIDAPTLT